MKQQIGLEMSKHNPASFIVSNRLAVLIQCYGAMKVMGSIIRAQRETIEIKSMLDVHISNLCLTYGINVVVSLYKLTYNLPKAS